MSPGPILESKDMHANFSEKGQKRAKICLKMFKKGQIFENFGENV